MRLKNGGSRRLDELEVGTMVKTPSGFEPIVGFLHAESVMSEYYHFATTNATLRISELHWLYANTVLTDPAKVSIGDTLTTSWGEEQVVSIVKRRALGAYHFIVPSGAYYVDDVLASTYDAHTPQWMWFQVVQRYVTLRYSVGLPVLPSGSDQFLDPLWAYNALDSCGMPSEAAAFASVVLVPLTIASEIVNLVGSSCASVMTSSMAVSGAATLALVFAHKHRALLPQA